MKTRINLDVLEVARPCPADWNAMSGGDQVRFCKHCSLHVYNISEMDRESAGRLVAQHEGHLCVRMYKRLDGTLISADCGGGWRLGLQRVNRRIAVMASAMIAVLAAVSGCQDKASPGNAMPTAPQGSPPPATSQPDLPVMGRVGALPVKVSPNDRIITGFISNPVPPPVTQPVHE